MKNVKKHLELLGLRAEDKVTGLKGVIDCISFDLYGCIQAVLRPSAKEDGELLKGTWMDVSRLRVTGKKPVMNLPDYDAGYVSEGGKGPADKPIM